MSSLKQRREIARLKKTGYKPVKTFNMKWINDTIDQVIVELSEYADREPEIGAAVAVAQSLKQLVSAYSQRNIDTPYRSAKLTETDVSQGVLNALSVQVELVIDKLDGTGSDDILDNIAENADDYYHQGILSEAGLEQIEAVESTYDTLMDLLDRTATTVSTERGVLGAELLDVRSYRGRARRRFFRK